jgi:predicted transcriptional regulator
MRNLKKLRRIAGMTQFALARKSRVSRSKIADVETERGVFTEAQSRRVLSVLTTCISKNVEDANASLISDGVTQGN